MRSVRIILPIAMSLAALLGCRVSRQDLPGSPAEVRVEIKLEWQSERQPESRADYEFKTVSVVLSDRKGLAIEKADVQVLMNGTPMQLHVARGNYYDRHPSYALSDEEREKLREDTDYAFTIVWPDGTKHEAATVHTPKRVTTAQFTLPEAHRAGAALTLAWRDLAESGELVAYRGFEYRNADGDQVLEGGSINSEDALRKTIGPGWFRKASDALTIPASYFETAAGKRVASFGAEITVTTEAKVSKTFDAKSSARAVRRIVLRTELTSDASP